nr:MAG TPA: hypothetical protein [Caudoviricetes sp.]
MLIQLARFLTTTDSQTRSGGFLFCCTPHNLLFIYTVFWCNN